MAPLLAALSPEMSVFLVEIGFPVVIFLVGALVMAKTGMLPQQRRLDTLLKDVIKGLEDQLRLRDETIKGLQQQIDAANSAAATMAEQARSDLREKDATLAALHTALVREQKETEDLRAVVADNQLKVGALVARQRTGRTGTDHGQDVH